MYLVVVLYLMRWPTVQLAGLPWPLLFNALERSKPAMGIRGDDALYGCWPSQFSLGSSSQSCAAARVARSGTSLIFGNEEIERE